MDSCIFLGGQKTVSGMVSQPVKRAEGPSQSAQSNPHDTKQSTNSTAQIYLTKTPQRGSLSIDATDSYRRVIIPVLANRLVKYLPRDGLPVEVLVGRRLVARPVHLLRMFQSGQGAGNRVQGVGWRAYIVQVLRRIKRTL